MAAFAIPGQCALVTCVQAFADRSSAVKKVLHAIVAVWLCSNLAFNYAMAITTLPGSTKLVPREVRTQSLAVPLAGFIVMMC